MSNSTYERIDSLFHLRSIAFVGFSISNPGHWTRVAFDSLIEFGFEGSIYLVNLKGGEIEGRRVYQSLEDIPEPVDYVISTVSAQASPGLVEECARKGVKTIQFYTAGFSETGEEEGIRLEAELVKIAKRKGIKILGPNCMGIYCPKSRLSFGVDFPKESGSVGAISQSGANAINLIKDAMLRGIRFSKVISHGNACDLNESDFLEYLAADTDTKIIALYIEGVKDGKRFRQALEKAAQEKVVILLKGGVTKGGARAAAGHTGALAGDEVVWDALCKQLGVIRVRSFEELVDTLVTILFMPLPRGRNVALIGGGGGPSVLITDEFEKRGLTVPPLPEELINQIREFTPIAGNILRNPIDYGQTMTEIEKLVETVNIISQWEMIDFLIGFFRPSTMPQNARPLLFWMVDRVLKATKALSKPIALVAIPSIVPEEAKETFPTIQRLVSLRLPIYFSFAGAADAISRVLSYNETRTDKLRK